MLWHRTLSSLMARPLLLARGSLLPLSKGGCTFFLQRLVPTLVALLLAGGSPGDLSGGSWALQALHMLPLYLHRPSCCFFLPSWGHRKVGPLS